MPYQYAALILLLLCIAPVLAAQTATGESLLILQRRYFHSGDLSTTCIRVDSEAGLHVERQPSRDSLSEVYERRLADTEFNTLRELLISQDVANLKSWESRIMLREDEEVLIGVVSLAGTTQRFSYSTGTGQSLPKGAKSLLDWMKQIQKR